MPTYAHTVSRTIRTWFAYGQSLLLTYDATKADEVKALVIQLRHEWSCLLHLDLVCNTFALELECPNGTSRIAILATAEYFQVAKKGLAPYLNSLRKTCKVKWRRIKV